MKETNVIYVISKAFHKNALTTMKEQEVVCREHLKKKGIMDNIVVFNDMQFGTKKPVLESLETLIKAGYIKSVTFKSIDLLSLGNIKDLMRLAIEYDIDIYVIDLNLTVILEILGFDV